MDPLRNRGVIYVSPVDIAAQERVEAAERLFSLIDGLRSILGSEETAELSNAACELIAGVENYATAAVIHAVVGINHGDVGTFAAPETTVRRTAAAAQRLREEVRRGR